MSSTTIPPPLSACHEVLVPTVVKNLHCLTFESQKHLHSDLFFVFKEKPVSEPKNILTISGKVDTIEFYLVNYKKVHSASFHDMLAFVDNMFILSIGKSTHVNRISLKLVEHTCFRRYLISDVLICF